MRTESPICCSLLLKSTCALKSVLVYFAGMTVGATVILSSHWTIILHFLWTTNWVQGGFFHAMIIDIFGTSPRIIAFFWFQIAGLRSHVTPIWSASLYWAFDWSTPSKFFKMLQISTWTAKAQMVKKSGQTQKNTNGVLVWRWMNVVGQTAQFKNHYTIPGYKITCYSSPICLSLLSF